jgi:hypothetical protein
MLTRIFMNSDITRCKSFDITKRVFTYCDNLQQGCRLSQLLKSLAIVVENTFHG